MKIDCFIVGAETDHELIALPTMRYKKGTPRAGQVACDARCWVGGRERMMPVKVRIPTPLRQHTGEKVEVIAED